jgi:1-acyl-sn-glycerol-3-phosphate acyltransferase
MILKAIAKMILYAGGWECVGGIPDVRKAVLIAAPHTSNWDGFWLLVYKVSVGLDLHFLAKDALFWWPLGNLLRALGALPLDRDAGTQVVRQLGEAFANNEQFYLALAPEGTRKWKPYWKTGFYRIARAANVPVFLGFIDYRTKRLGLGGSITLTGDTENDLDKIRAFYEPLSGRRPELASPVKFPPSA